MLLDHFYSNEKAKQTLVNFLTDERLPHTILLEGEDGCGKTTFARMIAAGILCGQERRLQRPCGECINCRLIMSDNHPDVFVEGSENKANSFHVEQIRQIRSDAYIRPNNGEYKVYILRNVHNMTEQAQNALLKIIEEPPKQVIFILTCNNRARILPTILSRSAVIPLFTCTHKECVNALKELVREEIVPERLEQAARFSQGNIGKALEILQNEKSLKAACDARRVGESICAGQEFELLSCLQEYTESKKREDFLKLLDGVRAYFFEMIRLKNGVDTQSTDLSVQAKNRLTTLQAVQIIDIIDTAAAQVVQNVGLGLVAASFCAKAKSLLQ